MPSAKSHTPRRRSKKALGAPPGTLTGDAAAPQPRMHVIAYGPDTFTEADIEDVQELAEYLGRWPVLWVNVDGVGNADTVAALGKTFNLHQLALEDVIHGHQHPKVEEYDDHLFIVACMMEPDLPVRTEQLSMFLREEAVVTFLEHPGDCLDPVRERIRKGRGRIREMGADYLAYCLLDAVVDFYFPAMDAFSDALERLEAQVLDEPTPEVVSRIHAAKRDLLNIRRSVAPLREAINALIRDGHDVISETTRIHLRDCHDHIYRILELVETYRELLGGLLDIYLSSVSNRMNDVMKVLTVIATIFIPLTFLAGIYGMNFTPEASPWNMPELGWHWGYPCLILLMVIVGVFELAFFWRKGWIGSTRRPGASESHAETGNAASTRNGSGQNGSKTEGN